MGRGSTSLRGECRPLTRRSRASTRGADSRPSHRQEEARIATTAASPLGTSVASPTRTMRERSLAADMLEGRAARAVLPSSIDLATFQDSLDPPHRRRGDPAPQSLYPQVDPSPSMVGGQATRAPQRRRKDPFGQSTAEPLREMSHWSRTTVSYHAELCRLGRDDETSADFARSLRPPSQSTDGVEPVRDHLSHVSIIRDSAIVLADAPLSTALAIRGELVGFHLPSSPS